MHNFKRRKPGGLWVPNVNRRRFVEREVSLPVRVAGFVRWELIDARTGLVKRSSPFTPNTIVDAGFDEMLDGNSPPFVLLYAGVGTDNTAPATSQTALGNEVARTQSNGGFGDSVSPGASSNYWSFERTRLFLEAEANGNLTEVGFFRNAGGPPMWMRQLFKDGVGNPTTIVKTSAEQLKVVYELRFYPPQTANLQSAVDIDGTPTDVRSRAYNIDNANGWGQIANFPFFNPGSQDAQAWESNTLPGVTGEQTGSPVGRSSVSAAAYVAGTFLRDMTLTWDAAVANFASGVGSITWSVGGGTGGTDMQATFITTFDPEIPKDNSKKLVVIVRLALAQGTADETAH